MRKKCKRKHYALVDPVRLAIEGAAITDTALLDRLRLLELSALECFRTGSATREEWMAVADMLNIQETLARDGIGPEALEPCLKAQNALGSAADRKASHGRFSVTGLELEAMRHAHEYFDLQRTSISRSRLEGAIKKTAERIRNTHPSLKVVV
jgi:hypothetical protein